jgi:thiol-disulfide isomerase/thioredoxin
MTDSASPATSDKKSFWTPTRLIFTFVVLTLVASFMLPSCQSDAARMQPNAPSNTNQTVTVKANPSQPAAAPPLPSQPLPASVLNTEMKDINGKSFKLSDYSGRVVVVNLWATWCPPCRKEIPELIRLNDEYKSRGVELIGLTNEDPTADELKVKDFVKNQGITYRVAWGSQSVALGLMQGNVKNVIPQSFVINGDGRVIEHIRGFDPDTMPQRLRQAVERALNSKG